MFRIASAVAQHTRLRKSLVLPHTWTNLFLKTKILCYLGTTVYRAWGRLNHRLAFSRGSFDFLTLIPISLRLFYCTIRLNHLKPKNREKWLSLVGGSKPSMKVYSAATVVESTQATKLDLRTSDANKETCLFPKCKYGAKHRQWHPKRKCAPWSISPTVASALCASTLRHCRWCTSMVFFRPFWFAFRFWRPK